MPQKRNVVHHPGRRVNAATVGPGHHENPPLLQVSRQAWRQKQNFKLNLEFTGAPASELHAPLPVMMDVWHWHWQIPSKHPASNENHPWAVSWKVQGGSPKERAWVRQKAALVPMTYRYCRPAQSILAPGAPSRKGYTPRWARAAREFFSFHPLFVLATLSRNGLPPPSARLSQLTLTCN